MSGGSSPEIIHAYTFFLEPSVGTLKTFLQAFMIVVFNSGTIRRILNPSQMTKADRDHPHPGNLFAGLPDRRFQRRHNWMAAQGVSDD